MSLRPPHAHAAMACAFALLIVAGATPAFADQRPFPDGAPPSSGAKSSDKKDAKPASESPFTDWSKVTKDATKKDGLFTSWTKRENVYWEIKKDQLGKPFLMNASFSKGIGTAYTLGGLPIADGLVQFEREGDRIFMM